MHFSGVQETSLICLIQSRFLLRVSERLEEVAFVCPRLLVQPACPLTLVWLCLGLLVPWVMSCPVCSSAWKCPHSPPWPREGPASGLWDSSLSWPLPPRRPFGYTFWTVLGRPLSFCLVMHRSRGDEELSAFWNRKTSTSSVLRKQQGWAFLNLRRDL